VQLIDRPRKLIAMQQVVLWNTADCRRQLAQNAGEQTEVDVHVNRIANVFGSCPGRENGAGECQ
jgi:endonuclease III